MNVNNLSQRQFPDALPPTMTAAQLRHTASLEQDESKYAGAPDMWRELGQTPVGMVQAIATDGATPREAPAPGAASASTPSRTATTTSPLPSRSTRRCSCRSSGGT